MLENSSEERRYEPSFALRVLPALSIQHIAAYIHHVRPVC